MQSTKQSRKKTRPKEKKKQQPINKEAKKVFILFVLLF